MNRVRPRWLSVLILHKWQWRGNHLVPIVGKIWDKENDIELETVANILSLSFQVKRRLYPENTVVKKLVIHIEYNDLILYKLLNNNVNLKELNLF